MIELLSETLNITPPKRKSSILMIDFL
eukprot:UN11314